MKQHYQRKTSKIIIEQMPLDADRTKLLWHVVERECDYRGFKAGETVIKPLSKPMPYNSARKKFERLVNG